MSEPHSTEPSAETASTSDTQPDTPATEPAANQQCANCNKAATSTAPLKPCNKCHSVHYCSRECQKTDLKKHKKVCAAAAQVYAQTADFKPQTIHAAPKEGHRKGLQKWQFDT